MEYTLEGKPLLIAVLYKETLSEICTGVKNNKIVESQLLGGIDLNKLNLDFMLGDGDVRLMWCKTFNPHKDKMKNGLQQLMTVKNLNYKI